MGVMSQNVDTVKFFISDLPDFNRMKMFYKQIKLTIRGSKPIKMKLFHIEKTLCFFVTLISNFPFQKTPLARRVAERDRGTNLLFLENFTAAC